MINYNTAVTELELVDLGGILLDEIGFIESFKYLRTAA